VCGFFLLADSWLSKFIQAFKLSYRLAVVQKIESFELKNTNDTFDMNRKSELLERKYADIKADFDQLDKVEEIRVGAIYKRLSNKYYLDENTIFRIVLKQTKFQKANNEVEGVP